VLQYGTGAFSASRDSLTHFIGLTPDSGPALALRGLCEFETGEYPQSLQDIQHGLSLGAANKLRNEEILRYHEALLLTLEGDFEDALHDYAFFSHDGVTDPEMLIGTGLAGLRTQLLPRDVDPGQRDLFLAAGAAALHFMAGDEAKAQQEFQGLFTRFPTAANAHYLYGYLLFAKDPDQAVQEFKRELEMAPSNAAANVMLAWYLVLQNDSSKALPYAQKAVADAPASPSAQLALGRSLVETGEVNGGVEHLEAALKLDPNNLEVHLALVKAYSKSGRKEDARLERLQCLDATKGEAATVAHP
jgi:tetratricopeptide (TPR) repeat protein